MEKLRLLQLENKKLCDDKEKISYGIELMNIPNFWNQGYMGNGVVVAILDTGCDYNHNNLKNNIIGGYNFTKEYNNPLNFMDKNGHGTHISGIIASNLYKNKGIVGVAPKAQLLILKTLTNDGIGSWKNLVDAIDYSINWRGPNKERVRVISMSLGLNKDIKDVHNIIKRANNNNIIIICSSGNDGDGNKQTIELQYPAIYQEVVQVGAIDKYRNLAYFSNTNNAVDILAPGVDIKSTFLNGTFATFSGTSMAAPHISGLISLLINKYETEYSKNLNNSEILELMFEYSKSFNLLPL